MSAQIFFDVYLLISGLFVGFLLGTAKADEDAEKERTKLARTGQRDTK